MDMSQQVPVFVALDVDHADKARQVVQTLGDAATYYKVGLELFLAAGSGFVTELVDQGKRIFLDLKFHDIPNTVRAATREAAKLGVDFITVHALGGKDMLMAAQEGVQQGSDLADRNTKVLAVTILTSHAVADLAAIGLKSPDPKENVLNLATLAEQARVHGVVCSPHEVAMIRANTGLAAMVPGIRPAGASANDQKRAATPSDAVRAGASYLVVGRPVVQAPDPKQALLAIQEEIDLALKLKEA